MRKRLTGVMAILLPEQKQNCCSLIASLHTNTQEILRQAQYDNKILNQVQNDEQKEKQSTLVSAKSTLTRFGHAIGVIQWRSKLKEAGAVLLQKQGPAAMSEKNKSKEILRQAQYDNEIPCRARNDGGKRMFRQAQHDKRKEITSSACSLLVKTGIAFCLLLNIAEAQTVLNVGDKLPLTPVQTVYTNANTTAPFSLGNHHTIIDFWATWCNPCVRNIKKLDSLQKVNNNGFEVLLVNSIITHDDEQKIKTCFDQLTKDNPGIHLQTIVKDSFFIKYFPHHTIPHYVWINDQQKIVAITDANALTRTNVQKFLNNEALALHVKNDYADTLVIPSLIKGTVRDFDHKLLASAEVYLRASKTKTYTNNKGEFSIMATQPNDTLVVKYRGEIALQKFLRKLSDSIMSIFVMPQAHTLENAVVYTGYQSLPKERATGSFEKLNTEQLNRRVSTDIISRLEGVSSVYFDKRDGGNNISIRGVSTLFGNKTPLIIIDNFAYDGDINAINPNDVESISILKDAAAASVWGVRAGNGVIVINTKKGKYNKAAVASFNAAFTWGSKPDLFYNKNFLQANEFIEIEKFLFGKGYYDADINNTTNRPPLSPVVELLAQKRAGTILASDADAKVEALKSVDTRAQLRDNMYETSMLQQYAVGYTGGCNNWAYNLSAGYDIKKDNLKRNESNRITVKSNNSFKLNKQLELNADIAFAQLNTNPNNMVLSQFSVKNKAFMFPYAALADENGRHLNVVKDYRMSYLDTAGAGRLLNWYYNPLDELARANNKQMQNDIRLNIGLKYNYSNNLSAELKYQYETQNSITKNVYSTDTYLARNYINMFTQINGTQIKYGVPVGGILDESNTTLNAQALCFQLNEHQSWKKKHELNTLVGTEVRQTTLNSSVYRTYGYNDYIGTYSNVNFVDYLPTYNNINGTQQIPNPQNFTGTTLRNISVYGNAAYTYLSRYGASISARKDASNLFGVNSNQKAVPLWSTGLFWNIDKEKWFAAKQLDRLKLRLTYGFTGNVDNSVSAFTTMQYFSNVQFTGLNYGVLVSPPNPELRWEKTGIWNAAIDFAAFKKRISGSIEWYYKKGTDLLGFAPVDQTTGVTNSAGQFSYKGNVASMKGMGWDINIHTNNIEGKFSWQTDVLFSANKTEVTKYYLNNTSSSAFLNYGTISPIEGKPVSSIFSYYWAGLDPINGDPQGYDANKNISKDYTALTSVKVDQLQYFGSALPQVFGSFNNSFSYKDFSLSVNIIYKLQYYFRRTSINYSALYASWAGHTDYLQRWQQPGDELKTNVPSMVYPVTNANRESFYQNAAALVEKGDHIRLQDIRLSYNLNNAAVKKVFHSAQLYLYANNLGILWRTNKQNIDPDYYNSGYPLPLTISAGCSLNF